MIMSGLVQGHGSTGDLSNEDAAVGWGLVWLTGVVHVATEDAHVPGVHVQLHLDVGRGGEGGGIGGGGGGLAWAAVTMRTAQVAAAATTSTATNTNNTAASANTTLNITRTHSMVAFTVVRIVAWTCAEIIAATVILSAHWQYHL